MKRLLLLMLLLALSVSTIQANQTQNPLLDMLALVPDTPDVAIVGYADFRAMETARPGAAQPQNWQELDTLIQADDPAAGLWLASMYGISTEAVDLVTSLLNNGEQIPGVMGFDWFAVDRVLTYGFPPSHGLILEGEFNTEAIAEAFSARGYSQTEMNGMSLWCGPEGCENGMATNPANINRANLFGGHLGREQPVLVMLPYLVTSPDIKTVEAVVNQSSSLAENPYYRAAVEAINNGGTLNQVMFIPPGELAPGIGNMLNRLSEEQKEAVIEALTAEFIPIPAYNLLVMADTATESEQVVMVMLVYDTQADAETAAQELPVRIENYTSYTTRKSLSEMFSDFQTSPEVTVYSSDETGKYITMLVLRAPLAPSEPDENGRYTSSSLVFSLLSRMLYNRDTDWLLPELVLPEE